MATAGRAAIRTTSRVAGTATGARGSAATGHPAATAAALSVLARGGTAVDAAVAAHAALAVVLPDACGVGGDSLVLVRTPRGRVTAYNGAGTTPAGAGADVASDGGAAVTVPGSVECWSRLVAAHGRLGLADVLAPAIGLARDGVPAGPDLCDAVRAQLPRLVRGGAGDWAVVRARPGDLVVQPELAAVLEGVAAGGPAAFYTGAVARALCDAVRRDGGTMTPADLAVHATVVAEPVSVAWDGGRVHVQPPASQGVLLAMALQWLDRHAGRHVDQHPVGHVDRFDGRPEATTDLLEHLGVELTEAVFGVRDRCAADGAALLDLPLHVDPARASRRGGPRAYLHTTGVAVADAEGTVVSSLLSVFDDFGSGTFVPEGGFVLNNRAGGFTAAPNAAGPGRRPVHTLAPALVEGPDGTVTALATPGADGQVQTLLQVLARLRWQGADLAGAVAAPRWRSVEGALLVGATHLAAGALRARGHRVELADDADARFGAVVAATHHGRAAAATATTSATGDWRREVSTGGI